ncbi:MAG: M23 family metallopeptidase [Proteobacteria bacterium]|nr:M23 family metallopeptidase [Pseudomonadota bacterium]
MNYPNIISYRNNFKGFFLPLAIWLLPCLAVISCSEDGPISLRKKIYMGQGKDYKAVVQGATVTFIKNYSSKNTAGVLCHFSAGDQFTIANMSRRTNGIVIQTDGLTRVCSPGSQDLFIASHDMYFGQAKPLNQARQHHDHHLSYNNHHQPQFYHPDYYDNTEIMISENIIGQSLTQPYRSAIVFPLFDQPLDDYITEGRGFGAERDYGYRRHAANDLLEHEGYPVFAVADGKVLDYYPFYAATDAVVVDHGNFVVRYGEVSSMADGLKIGDQVGAGQKIGYIGHLEMLHFELYSGEAKGPLTVENNYPFKRRWDLKDPTSFLKKLENNKIFPRYY